MSHESFLRDGVAVANRGEWLAEFYVPNAQGVIETLRFSRRGTATGSAVITIGSDTIPAHTPFRRRLEVAPIIQASLWRSGAILSRSVPSFGEVRLTNTDGGLDRYRPKQGYRWAGATGRVYFCDYSDIQNTIGKVFDGPLGMPRFSMMAPVTVPLLGREADFQVSVSNRVFRGTRYQLELFGDRTVGFGAPDALNITGDLTIEGWLWLDALPTGASGVGFWGWFFGTRAPWRMIVEVSGQLRVEAHVGGALQSRTSTAALAAQKPYHFAWRVSAGAVTLVLWNEDAQIETVETLTPFTSATRDSNVGCTLNIRSASNPAFRPWLDEFRVFGRARTLSEIRADRHRPLHSGAYPSGLVHYLKMDDGAGTTVTDSSATANGTISGAGTSTWLWAMEGDESLAGTSKPDIWGPKFGAQPVLVDPIRYVYQVAGGGGVKSIASYEGGNPHAMEATYASMRDLMTTAPSVAGRSKPYLARGLFRLKDQPLLTVAATVEGYNDGPLGYVDTAATLTRDLVTRRGPKLADPAGLDTASFTAYASAAPAKMGLYVQNPRQMMLDAALDEVNRGAFGWWGYVRASTALHVERFLGPAATADYNFDSRHIAAIDDLPPQAVIWEVVVRFARNSVVLQEDQVASTVKGTAAWQQWAQEWQTEVRSDEDLLADYPGEASRSLTIDTGLYERADAAALADDTLELLKGLREGFALTLKAVGLQVKVGQTCTLNVTLQDGIVRAGLDGTTKFIILSTDDRRQNGEVRVEVWA